MYAIIMVIDLSNEDGYTAHHNVKSELMPIIKEWDDPGGALRLPHHGVEAIKTNNPGMILQIIMAQSISCHFCFIS